MKDQANTRTSHKAITRALIMTAATLPLAWLACMPVPVTDVTGAVSIFFDGAEGAGSGATDFSFGGASFSGGTIRTVGNLGLYGSGRFAYEVVEASSVLVEFDNPVDFLELVFIVSGEGSAVLTAFDAEGNDVGSIEAGTDRAAQTVELSANAVGVEAFHTGAGDSWIDNFTFRSTGN